ncbi:MAG: VTT domain-containing protein [Myxococcales bacterium]|nr:VTT domain-containing protein [Myxococcales bacterium]MDH3482940.1 VTT domain-containing protein [Myxococcales bacterium]
MDRGSLLKIALVAVVVSLIAWFYATEGYEKVDPEAMRVWIRNAGGWGGVLFVVAYSCLQPFGVNGLFFLLSAPLIWSPTDAFLLNWIGTVGTGAFSFAIARFVARDWVQKRLPGRVRRFDDRLHARGFVTVLLLRLVFYTTPTVQYALGVSRVKVGPFIVGTILGVAPFTLLTTLLGIRMSAWLDAHPVSSWPWDQIGPLLVVAAVVIAAISIVILRKWRSRAVDGMHSRHG